jgi:hypothetical protein
MKKFQEQLTDFLIENSFLFTSYKTPLIKYLESFEDLIAFRVPFQIKPKDFVQFYKDKIVQTYESAVNGSLILATAIQIDIDNHIILTYSSDEDENLILLITLYLKDPSQIPEWLKFLKQYETARKTQQTLGFARYT